MASQKSATSRLNLGLRIFFSEFVRVSLRRPSQALFFGRTVLWQAAAIGGVAGAYHHVSSGPRRKVRRFSKGPAAAE